MLAPAVFPEKRLKVEAKSAAAAPAAKEAAAVQVTASPMPASPVSAPSVAQAALPLVAPPQKGLGPEDRERLKHALAELEACRRLLDKINEGGR
jgi:hypothetical protein